jgi:hypothetical protein
MEENKIISYPISVLFFIRLMWGSYISWIIIPTYIITLTYIYKIIILFLILMFIILIFLKIRIKSFILKLDNLLNLYLRIIWFIRTVRVLSFKKVLIRGLMIIKILDHGWLEFIGSQKIYINLTAYSLNLDKIFNLSLKLFLSLFIILIVLLFYLCLNSLKRT